MDLDDLLRAALRQPRPAHTPEATKVICAGSDGLQVILNYLESCDPAPQQFAIAELLSCFCDDQLPRIGARIDSASPLVLSTLGVALGWFGLHTAPIVAEKMTVASHQSRLLCAWGIGGVMCAATRYRELDALDVLRGQVGKNLAAGTLATSTAELEMNISWSRAALWVFRNRRLFVVGTRTPLGPIGETGLPHQVQILPTADWNRACLIQNWLVTSGMIEPDELRVLGVQWRSHPDPAAIALHWGRGALWSLRELSREVVQSVG